MSVVRPASTLPQATMCHVFAIGQVNERPLTRRSRLGRVAQGLEHYRVDGLLAVDAVLEVRDAGPGVERVETQVPEPLVHLGPELALKRQPLLPGRLAEELI